MREVQTIRRPVSVPGLLQEKAKSHMDLGLIPDMQTLCEDIYLTKYLQTDPPSALNFVPVMRDFEISDDRELIGFHNNPENNYVLVQNEYVKIVLIRWEPGAVSSIHGHASGGCVVKVLQGRILENRYTTDGENRLLSSGTYYKDNIVYIDDNLGYHSVGNPFREAAISLHVYTPGLK